jgi:CRISPR-associated endonuclease/helicase Cas3
MNASNLSLAAQSLWGKLSRDNPELFLPLYVHMSDTAALAELLWDFWIPQGTKKIIVSGMGIDVQAIGEVAACDLARRLFVFLSAGHDCGKNTPEFVAKAEYPSPEVFSRIETQLPIPTNRHNKNKVPHALASQLIAERNGINRSIAIVLGGHHGKPPTLCQIEHDGTDYAENSGFRNPTWCAVQDELFQFAADIAQVDIKSEPFSHINLNKQAQIILTGLVIVADWVASNEEFFPYIQALELPNSSESRAQYAWSNLNFPSYKKASDEWKRPDFWQHRFPITTPYPVQEAVVRELANVAQPGMVILEAPMGEGKTEAAFAASELLGSKTGRNGAFIALPTQATANGLFERTTNWIKKLGHRRTLTLAHGKAAFNDDYQGIKLKQVHAGDDDEDTIVVHDWLQGRKRGLLAEFVVGTIDQVLMSALKQKHLALWHLGLANKVVIIDECHAYDAYMSQYLYKVLNWLGAYEVPVVLLSATLPVDKRRKLLDAYLGVDARKSVPEIPAWRATEEHVIEEPAEDPTESAPLHYPLITYTDGQEVRFCMPPSAEGRATEISVEYLPDDDALVPKLQELLAQGGCAGLIFNTVSRAQKMTRLLIKHFDSECVHLLHSRFLSVDRLKREQALRDDLGPESTNRPQRSIVVGTQVLEQSLDIDFDVLVTDICPMDLLVQRLGRLHRHQQTKRPKGLQRAQCFITGVTGSDGGAGPDGAGIGNTELTCRTKNANPEFDKGSQAVYGEYFLLNTWLLLPDRITLPKDIARLVQAAYVPEGLSVDEYLRERYQQAQAKERKKWHDKEIRANCFQIENPRQGRDTIEGWLEMTITDDATGKKGEATVRDTGDSLDVIVVQRDDTGNLCVVPWIPLSGGEGIARDRVPTEKMAKLLASCSVSLPPELKGPWNIDTVIHELEVIAKENFLDRWVEAYWLKGELFLVLDVENKAELSGHILRYDQELGLFIEKEEG